MPLYEYECENCAHRFEVIQKFSDAPIAVCPKCGGGPVQKLLSSPAIQSKGSGFYLTDYGRGTGSKSDGGSTKAGKSDTGSTGEAAAKTESSSSTSVAKPTGGDASATKSTPAKAD